MKREVIIGICGFAFIIMMIVALFKNKDVQDSAENVLHEIRTFDAWKQSAYTPPVYYPQNLQGNQGYCQSQPGFIQQAAMQGAPAIFSGQDAPVLIKQFGVEAIAVGGGKVKITGVMGASWADKAGLRAGDILLTFNAKKITSMEQFQSLLAKAPPEKDYKITFLRAGRTKHCLVTVGEGEMEGFTPIPVPK